MGDDSKHTLSLSDIERYYVDEGGYGCDHVVRVHRMAMWIARQVGANGFLKKFLQGFPCAAVQIGEEFAIIEEIATEYRRRGIGMLKTKCRWGMGLRTSSHSHSPNSTACFW